MAGLLVRCPVCDLMFQGQCDTVATQGPRYGFDCEACGKFELTGSAYNDTSGSLRYDLSPVERAALSHRLRSSSDSAGAAIIIDTYWFENFIGKARLPSPAIQANNLIRVIGDNVLETGGNLSVLPSTAPRIGSPNLSAMFQLIRELIQRDVVAEASTDVIQLRSGSKISNPTYNLTLKGWEHFETETRGGVAGNYGFMAMKFGDPVLDPLVEATIKPGIKQAIGYELVDMRSVAQAGVIDNIMRAQIRDSAFVLVDLTHDNAGAYWEAGYAEGLGKPVIYVCEQGKFEEAKTHFDTNHCTTVVWSVDDPEKFISELVATLRRSLNLFSTGA